MPLILSGIYTAISFDIMIKIQKTAFFLLILWSFFSCKENEVQIVPNELLDIVLNENRQYLEIGATFQLQAEIQSKGNPKEFDIIWSSSDEKVASVTKNGLVTAIKTGFVTITAAAEDKKAICELFVFDSNRDQMTQAKMFFLGNAYATGKSNVFVLYLTTKDVNLADLSGAGEYLFVEMHVEPTIADFLPNGQYNVVSDFINGNKTEYNKFLPNTVSPGFVERGNRWGTWHNTLQENAHLESVPIVRGTIDAAAAGTESQYIITYNLYDINGNQFSGIYQGGLKLYDLN